MIDVFHIERFATHDGPGIRTTVFLKGCTLRCPWCANPESWEKTPSLLYDETRCMKCGQCAASCPSHALTYHDTVQYEASQCLHCEICVKQCLHDALRFAGTHMSIQDVVDEVLKDKDYYDNSHGGVTISGGEPFVQFPAFLSLLKALKEKKLHVAVETTGSYEQEKLLEALPYIDLLLYDIKHLDKQKLINVTKGRYDEIMSNFTYVAAHCPQKLIIRIPVIPEFNSDEAGLHQMLDTIHACGVEEVHLLPYHTLGRNKWNQLRKTYTWRDQMLDKEELRSCVTYGETMGMHIIIGG